MNRSATLGQKLRQCYRCVRVVTEVMMAVRPSATLKLQSALPELQFHKATASAKEKKKKTTHVIYDVRLSSLVRIPITWFTVPIIHPCVSYLSHSIHGFNNAGSIYLDNSVTVCFFFFSFALHCSPQQIQQTINSPLITVTILEKVYKTYINTKIHKRF